MVGSATAGAATFAFGAGVATFFSPCAYALLPGYVGYYVSSVEEPESDAPVGGALVRGMAAFLGVVVVFATFSAGLLVAGRTIEPLLGLLEPVVGVALLVLGVVVLLGDGPTFHITLPERRASTLGFFVFGAGYAVAGAGCVAPLFLAIVFRSLTAPVGQAAVLLGGYTLGFGLLLLGATVAIAVGRRGLVDRLGEHRGLLDSAAGVALVFAGCYQLYVAL
jgi:cytochrome c-type biogenesis protein